MAQNLDQKSIFEFLEKIKDYTQFESVTVAPDGAVSVKYAARLPEPQKPAKERKPTPTAIDSLKEVPPPFVFNRAD